uniref:Activin types I and II receptor domain-containing protein n=1 Tax=Strongyloides stercoralis TaxID=6248 RepID=A0A0K0E709_STRER
MHLSFLKLLFIYLLFYIYKKSECRWYKHNKNYRLRYLKRELLIHEFDNSSYNYPDKSSLNNLYCNYYVKNWPSLTLDVPRYTIPCPEVNDKCVTITGRNKDGKSLWEGCFSTSKILFNYLNTSCNENNCVNVVDKNQNRNGVSCCCTSKLCNHDLFKSSSKTSFIYLFIFATFFVLFLI